MGKRFNLLLIIFGMVVLYACYYFVLPNIINLERLNPKITKYVKEKYGYNISLDKPDFKMGYSPSIWLKADKFVLLNDDKTIAMSVNKPVIKVSLLPLIIDRINLTYFSADNVFADIYYDNKREVTLGQYLIFKSTNFVVNADNSKILISNYKINLNDNVKKDTTKILGKYFNIDEYKLDKSLKASVNFEIISGSNKSVVNLFADTKLPFLKHLDKYTPELSFSVTNLSLAKFSNFINYFTNNRVSDISGLINLEIHSDKRIFGRKQYLSNLLIDNFYIKTNLFEKEYNYPGRILIKSNYLLENKELTIPSFTISSPKFSAKLSGSINKISSKYPVPNLDFKMYGAKIEDILDIFPYCTKLDDYTKINISELKKAAFKSNVDMNLKFSGNFVKPNIYGKIDITDAIFERPIKNAQKNPNIKLEFLKDIVKFNTDVSAGIDKIVKINGQIGLYGANNSNLMIESSDLIDLSEAQRLIIPLHKTFNFLLGPLPVMSLSGYGGIKLKFHGNKKSPHIFGQIVTSNASASFLEIPNLVLNDTNALINFDDSNAIFTLKNGTIDGKSAFISGECKLNGEFDFNAKLPNQDIGYLLAAFKNSSILNEFASKINLIEASSGACDFNANVKGHITDANDIIIGKNVHVKGEIILKSIKAKFVKTRRYVNNIFGKIKINDLAIDLNISSYIGAAKLELVGLINANEANLNFKLAKAYLTDVINT
ncbi:hypothetical protein IKE67_04170, partial [bacterium]|nr:hypothetical protein [bacterium]